MPLTFPSHQGLIAPLWRRWPRSFNVLALCIGAGAPDAVDGIAALFRGHLGQWYGHTLAGLFVFCLPMGLVLTKLVGGVGKRLSDLARPQGILPEFFAKVGNHIQLLNNAPARTSRFLRLLFVTCSVWVGAFSHLFFDLISHGSFLWFYPWYENHRFFPSWWYIAWFEIPVPGYRNTYPMGPHLLVWIFLSVLGTVVLFWPFLRTKTRV